MGLLNALSFVSIGFLFATGAIIAWSLFQILLAIIKEVYIKYCIKKYYKVKEQPKKPSGMEFGKFND